MENQRSAIGNPVRVCTIDDCPNDDNLKLCPNQEYKEYILAAAKACNMIPQAIAALIDAEAAKVAEMVPNPRYNEAKPTDKHGKPIPPTIPRRTNRWDPASVPPKGTARGLTQFLKGTWKGMALTKGTFLHQVALERGYVTTETRTKVVRKATKKRPEVTRTFDVLVVKNEPALLAMRDEAECSIRTCADYGLMNLRYLMKDKRFKIDGLSDSDKAKVFYSMHFLGAGDAPKFFSNTLTEERAREILEMQIATSKAAEYLEQEGNWINAHRRQLLTFIDRHIVPMNFACDMAKVPNVRPFYDIVIAIGGQHPADFPRERAPTTDGQENHS